jgi:hypothetical protein
VMVHPSDSGAWKALHDFDADFTRDAQNVRIGLAINGFSPYNTSAVSYSLAYLCYSVQHSTCSLHEI